MIDKKEVTVTVNGVDYTATMGLEQFPGWLKPSVVTDDRGVYWQSSSGELSDDEYNEIVELLAQKYEASAAAAALGRLGGKVKSEEKARTARENKLKSLAEGKPKGGRPRKQN